MTVLDELLLNCERDESCLAYVRVSGVARPLSDFCVIFHKCLCNVQSIFKYSEGS